MNARVKDGEATVWLCGELTDATIPDADRYHLMINSPGGNAQAGFALYQALKGKDVVVTITEKCMSAAVIPLCAARHVRMERSATLMLHEPLTTVYGKRRDLLEHAEKLEDMAELSVRLFSDKTGASRDRIRNLMLADTYLTAEAAVRLGFADEIFDMAPVDLADELPEVAGNAPAVDESKAKLLIELLQALGPIETADRPKLHRELSAWFAQNIHEVKEPVTC